MLKKSILPPLLLTLYFMTSIQQLCAEECEECTCYNFNQDIAFGPEIYHVTRSRLGVDQTGNVYGARITYERFKPCGFYWALDALYATGTMRGNLVVENEAEEVAFEEGFDERSVDGFDDGFAEGFEEGFEESFEEGFDDGFEVEADPEEINLRSTLTDFNIEGRIGYTLQANIWLQPSITPFAGYGYYEEITKFNSPSPTHVKFTTHYDYFVLGFLSKIWVSDYLSTGFNFKMRFSWNTKCEVTDDPDPEFNDKTMLVDDKYAYRFELPIVMQCFPCIKRFAIALTPFYEIRQYGGRENWPCDFFDTTLHMYGANFQFIFKF